MKRLLVLLVACCLVMGGCGKTDDGDISTTGENWIENMLESGQQQIDEAEEILREAYSIDGFEDAGREYEKFNSYASENGLDGSLIFVKGKVLSQTVRKGALGIIIEQEDGNRWLVSVAQDCVLDGIDDMDIRVFGTYMGFSDVYNVPAVGVASWSEDTEIMDNTRIECKEGGEYKTIYKYMDYLMAELEKKEEKEESEQIESPKHTEPSNTITTGQKNALKSAKDYLSFTAFSRDGLIDQLEYEKYSTEEATYAADNCGADWNEQALKSAENYLSFTAFSYKGLIDQLEYEKYTKEQATFAADNCGADWNEQAAKSAKNYLEITSFSKDGLIDQLEFEGYTHEQAVYGAEQNGY